ncbi:MAG: homoserine O-succinyltransferase [Microbacteriaceae bacterium]|nr:homoserine O-succinyltransferase [Microbacteriaceae bacterium]
MPITLQDDFPAKDILQKEDIFAINNERARSQDIRPLRLLILNLMPNKIATETQLLRLISQSPLQIDVDFLKISSHQHKNTSLAHLSKFYHTFDSVKDRFYDGMIITGAPIETLPFVEVDYWQEMQQILEWSQTHTTSTLHICWGAQAALFHHYGVEKVLYNEKLFGVYDSFIEKPHRLFRGFDDIFSIPQSRYTGIELQPEHLEYLCQIDNNEEIGASILISRDERNIFVLGHLEYDTETLHEEYVRDQKRELGTDKPVNYYRGEKICNTWRSSAFLFYHNWLNDVYQITPYKLEDIAVERQRLKQQ